MKAGLIGRGLALALAMLVGTSGARAENSLQLTSNYEEVDAVPVSGGVVSSSYAAAETGEVTTGSAVSDSPCCSSCNTCNSCGAAGCCCASALGAFADPGPRVGVYGFGGMDSWRGTNQGLLQNSNGVVSGVNAAVPVPVLEDYGIGFQGGASYGVYNWDGQVNYNNPSASQTQLFITTGFFRHADAGLPLSFGIVHDWMLLHANGLLDNSPTVGQWRGQVAYAVNTWNEIGVWGTVHDNTSNKTYGVPRIFSFTQQYQAIDQVNAFWHHKFGQYGADGTFYVGVPLGDRLNSDPFVGAIIGRGGRVGTLTTGTNWFVPINNYLSAYANGMYMIPENRTFSLNGGVPAAQSYWNFSFGLAFYPGGSSRSATVAGRKWMPYMPVANNSNFLLQTGVTP